MVKKASGLVLIGSLFLAAPASAQSLSNSALKVDFGVTSVTTAAPTVKFVDETPAPRQGSSASWGPIIFGGLGFHNGGGLAVGGGVLGRNFLDHENYGLQIDGMYQTVGGCDFAECSASSIGIGAMFLYNFNESSSGWVPYVGGGLLWSRVSFSYDDDFFGCGEIFDCSASASGIDFQAAGGVRKGKLGFEGRFGGWGGGALLVTFRPGGGN